MKNNKIEESRQAYLKEANEYLDVLRRLINAALNHAEDAGCDIGYEKVYDELELDSDYLYKMNSVEAGDDKALIECYDKFKDIYKTNRLAVEEFIDKHMIG